ISRTHCLKDLFRHLWRGRLAVRRPLEPIKNRRAEPPRGNSFRNDKVETEGIELAQISKQVRSPFAKVFSVAEISACEKMQAVRPWMPCEQTNALVIFR